MNKIIEAGTERSNIPSADESIFEMDLYFDEQLDSAINDGRWGEVLIVDD